MNYPTLEQFEALLTQACEILTVECQDKLAYSESKLFENRVREVIRSLLAEFKIQVDFSPHPYGFPDIVLGELGVEVKFTTNDTWRSVANSVFESFRNKDVKEIYVVFGKMGGKASVRWARYEECVMHVRTSHVPRFEVDIDATESLFKKCRWPLKVHHFMATFEASKCTTLGACPTSSKYPCKPLSSPCTRWAIPSAPLPVNWASTGAPCAVMSMLLTPV